MLAGNTQFLLRIDAPIPQKYSQTHPRTFFSTPDCINFPKPTTRRSARFKSADLARYGVYEFRDPSKVVRHPKVI